jgi:hypothetical protein
MAWIENLEVPVIAALSMAGADRQGGGDPQGPIAPSGLHHTQRAGIPMGAPVGSSTYDVDAMR